MPTTFKFRELRVDIREGVTLVIDVDSPEAVKAALTALQKDGLFKLHSLEGQSQHEKHERVNQSDNSKETPEALVETRAGIPSGTLRSKNVLGFKDGIPQLLRPTAFASVSDATLILLFAVEAGLKQQSISFDALKALYDAQNIKSGSALSMLLNNLKNAGYIDKGVYATDRTVRLTAKGEKKAIEVLKN